MGNGNSSNLVDTSDTFNDQIFKVDNINSNGRKHASAKIQVSNEDLCIRQKNRQSLHIPLETIRRYGLDGSIFILECGRRAPLGQARYAFRCKRASQLVDCLDRRITVISKELTERLQEELRTPSLSTLTNVSLVSHRQETFRRSQTPRRRAHSDDGIFNRLSPSLLASSNSFSSISIHSQGTFSYSNSDAMFSENYLAFVPNSEDQNEPSTSPTFVARLKPTFEQTRTPELDYLPFSTQISSEPDRSNSSDKMTSNLMKSYVYIDHEKTTTLKQITAERLQQHLRHVEI